MSDPVTMAIIAGAAGGGTSKLIEKVYNSGEQWIKSYFKNHDIKAEEEAQNNKNEFLNYLAEKIKVLEESSQIMKEKIDTALEKPDLAIMLRRAMLTAAQTKSKEKHEILARLVADRLTVESESILALASKIACDAIAYTNMRQLKILGLHANLVYIRPHPYPPTGISKDEFTEAAIKILNKQFEPFLDLDIKEIDFLHLESLSCIKWESFIERDLAKAFSRNDFLFDLQKYEKTEYGEIIMKLWKDKGLQTILLTTVGQVIGIYVSDILSKKNTQFVGWE
jgi:hypothetical protein